MIVRGKRHWWQYFTHPGLVLASPAIILYTAFFVWPALQAFYVSMTDWTGFAPVKKWVGFANFKELYYEKLYLSAVANNFIFMFGVGIAMFAFALLFAAVLSNRDFPGRKFFKTVLFAPYVVSIVAIAVLWTFIYDPKWGLLNSLLSVLVTWAVEAAHALHLTEIESYQVGILWMGSRWMSILSMAVVMVWGGVGFYVILLIAGIDRIPGDYYEAAKIDGATEKQSFFHITLPLLREVLIIAISIHIIGSLSNSAWCGR